MAKFRICHISDLHIAADANRSSLVDPDAIVRSSLKAIIKGKNPLTPPSHNSRAAYALARQLETIREQYDLILVTGDLGATGLSADLSAARAYFEGTLTDAQIVRSIPRIADIPVAVLPGNHDRWETPKTYAPGASNFEAPGHFGEGWRTLDAKFKVDLGSPGGPVHSFHLGKDGEILSIVCVDFSATRATQASEYIGKGHVYDDVLRQLEHVTNLSRIKFKGTAIIWAAHFPPRFQGLPNSLALINEDKVLDLADRLCVSTLICGHTHSARQYFVPLKSSNLHVLACGTTLEYNPANSKLSFQLVDLDASHGEVISSTVNCLFWKEENGVGLFS